MQENAAPLPCTHRMSELFDQVAEKFARETDRAMQINGYRRGALFVELARRSVVPGGDVLDYGCGPGRLSLMLARQGFRVRGVDISAGMIAQARALEKNGLCVEFDTLVNEVEANEVVPLPAHSCDAIVCSSVIEYVVNREELLRNFRQALRRPGTLIISFANRSSLWRKYTLWQASANANPMYAPHHQSWDWREFRALLQRAGFETVMRPTYFESPLDWKRWGSLFRRVPWGGALGVVVVRPTRLHR